MNLQQNPLVGGVEMFGFSKTRVSGLQFNKFALLGGFLVCIGYYVGAKLGFALTLHPRPVSVMWPPNAVLTAALVLSPIRYWWFLLACAVPAHVMVQLEGEIPT